MLSESDIRSAECVIRSAQSDIRSAESVIRSAEREIVSSGSEKGALRARIGMLGATL